MSIAWEHHRERTGIRKVSSPFYQNPSHDPSRFGRFLEIIDTFLIPNLSRRRDLAMTFSGYPTKTVILKL